MTIITEKATAVGTMRKATPVEIMKRAIPAEAAVGAAAAEDAAQTFALDMSEVLNPGELDLEELCKEMGLMEE